jgi:hypothetical protein
MALCPDGQKVKAYASRQNSSVHADFARTHSSSSTIASFLNALRWFVFIRVLFERVMFIDVIKGRTYRSEREEKDIYPGDQEGESKTKVEKEILVK